MAVPFLCGDDRLRHRLAVRHVGYERAQPVWLELLLVNLRRMACEHAEPAAALPAAERLASSL
jgi:hypothetical protein